MDALIGALTSHASRSRDVALARRERSRPAYPDGHVGPHAALCHVALCHVTGHCENPLVRTFGLAPVDDSGYRPYGSLFVEFARVVVGDNAIAIEVVCL
jgi:hypothetical protein